MIKDTRYIIKRVIIGVLISLILSFIYACEVKAEGTTDIEFENYNLNYNDTSTATERILFSNSNGIYKNWGRSNLIFTLTIYRYAEGLSVQIPMLTEVRVRSNNNTYVSCDIGNNPLVYNNGDVMKATTYNVLCDTSFGSVGLQEIRAFFQPAVNTAFGVQTSTQMVVYKNINDRMYTLLKNIINNQGIINGSITSLNTMLDAKLQEIITYQYNESIALSHIQDTITTINNNIINLITIIQASNQAIIANQDENTQEQIESQEVCSIIDNNKIKDNGYLENNGTINNQGNDRGVTDYIKITNKSKIKNIVTNNTSNGNLLCFYNINKEKITCVNSTNYNNNDNITIPDNANYVRFTIIRVTNRPQFEICNNGNQATNDSINDVNDTLNDSSVDNPNNALSDMEQNEISNSVISDLLLLPVTLFQNILNSINGTCNSFSLGSLFGTNLTMPCINIQNIIGSTLWGVIDVLFCGIFVLSMRKKFVDIFENITSLKDRGNELE